MKIQLNVSRDEIVTAMKGASQLTHGVLPDEVARGWVIQIVRRVGAAYRNQLHGQRRVQKAMAKQRRQMGRDFKRVNYSKP